MLSLISFYDFPTPKVVQACSSNPCLNGGVCVESSAGFTCSCTPQFTGLQCEQQGKRFYLG